jgi:hypothetical protein
MYGRPPGVKHVGVDRALKRYGAIPRVTVTRIVGGGPHHPFHCIPASAVFPGGSARNEDARGRAQGSGSSGGAWLTRGVGESPANVTPG